MTSRRVLPILIGVVTGLYAAHGWRRYEVFRSAGYDLGIFDQAIRHYAHFHAPISAIKGPGYNLLGDHFHPVLTLLAPLYWIWPDPRMLALVTAALLGVSGFPVFAFTARRFGDQVALLTVAGYLLWWPLQGLVEYDFHEIAFAVPVVAWLIDALDRGRYRTVLLLCGLLMTVREDMGLVLVMVAVILATKRRFSWAAFIAAIGSVGYLAVTVVLIPFFSATGTWAYWNYPALGPDPASAVSHVLRHPLSTAALLVSAEAKRRLLLYLFLPLGFLGMASPYILLAVPILLERLLGARESLWSTDYHYNAILAPIIVLAVVDVVRRLVSAHPRLGKLRSAPAVALCAAVAFGMTVAGPYPLRMLFGEGMWETTAHVRAQEAAVAAIPPGVCVEADDRIIPHLVATHWVTTPLHSDGHATWMILDLSMPNIGGTADETPAEAFLTAEEDGFTVQMRSDQMVVLSRSGPIDAICSNVD